MTQSNEMPKEIYLFPSTQSIGDRGFTTTEPEKTCEGLDYTKYIRADLTPPQSPNRAVLDALRSISSMGHGKGVRGAVCVTTSMLAQIADQALATANQADEVKVIPDIILDALQDYRDGHCFDDSEYGIAIDAFLKRQKGR